MSVQLMAYRRIAVPAFSHFLYRGFECMINEQGALLVRNEEYDEWIRLNQPEFRTDFLFSHMEDLNLLPAVNWHMDPYLDSDEAWEIYQKSLRGIGPDRRVG